MIICKKKAERGALLVVTAVSDVTLDG